MFRLVQWDFFSAPLLSLLSLLGRRKSRRHWEEISWKYSPWACWLAPMIPIVVGLVALVWLVLSVGRSLPPPADEMAVGWVSGSELFFSDLCLTNRQPNETLSGNQVCNQPEVTVITVIDE